MRPHGKGGVGRRPITKGSDRYALAVFVNGDDQSGGICPKEFIIDGFDLVDFEGVSHVDMLPSSMSRL
jgi:hypothetical protein